MDGVEGVDVVTNWRNDLTGNLRESQGDVTYYIYIYIDVTDMRYYIHHKEMLQIVTVYI